MLAGLTGVDGLDGVPVVGCGDEDAVDVLSFEDVSVVAVGLGLLLGAAPGGFETVVVRVAHGRDLDFPLLLEAQHVLQVRAAHAAHADVRDDKATVGAGFAIRGEDAVRDDRGEANRARAEDGGGFEEVAAAVAKCVFHRRVRGGVLAGRGERCNLSLGLRGEVRRLEALGEFVEAEGGGRVRTGEVHVVPGGNLVLQAHSPEAGVHDHAAEALAQEVLARAHRGHEHAGGAARGRVGLGPREGHEGLGAGPVVGLHAGQDLAHDQHLAVVRDGRADGIDIGRPPHGIHATQNGVRALSLVSTGLSEQLLAFTKYFIQSSADLKRFFGVCAPAKFTILSFMPQI